jgi:hypothetical protein
MAWHLAWTPNDPSSAAESRRLDVHCRDEMGSSPRFRIIVPFVSDSLLLHSKGGIHGEFYAVRGGPFQDLLQVSVSTIPGPDGAPEVVAPARLPNLCHALNKVLGLVVIRFLRTHSCCEGFKGQLAPAKLRSFE